MASDNGMDRRRFLRNTLMGGAGLTLAGSALWEAAAQIVNTPQINYINGVGLDDPMLVQLSINENPLGASRMAVEAVAKRLFTMNRYPFNRELEEALGKFHGVSPDTVFLGTGSSEILNCLVLAAYFDRQGNTVTGFPSYPALPQTTEALGRQVKRVPLTKDWKLDLDAMHRAIDKDTRLVSVCNPNNPTGQILDPAALERFIRSVPKEVLVCVDEAYIHFVDDPNYPSMIPLTREVDNLLVSRTFSKAYGLGGVRVGYGVGNPELLKRMMKFTIPDLNKNTLSLAAALGALQDPDHVRRTVRVVQEGKKYLYAELQTMGYEVIPTQTIFVPVKVGADVQTLIDRLAERKVRVSKAFDMDGYMRISVGLPRENEAFITAFKSVRNAL
jgi:histidinol-phosphate aminotransferase